ncbi:TonB-dependent receptor domain-containing protein [Marinomonas sp. ef1]|uniref:TonB-dependent receptor domain-containing protein n=1 Tax=Marinomonas sp. ef1 TaxID=2005043 RepID=UPI000C28316E|nr:TonB-dependent receptor [Marinomonas sp. ef1]
MTPSTRHYKLTTLAALISATTYSATLLAEESIVDLDKLVVSASGYEQQISDAPASISVVTRADLETKQFRDLAEALADVEGVDVRGGTGKTGGLDISIRGMPSDYTLILIDGRRQNVAGSVTPNGFGAALTSFMPPISSIERIEVIRGPMSTLYGSDAIGGVVNIITRKIAAEPSGSIRIEMGLPEDSKWGASQKTDLYVTSPIIDNKLGVAVRGSIYNREASDWILAPGASKSGRNPAPAETQQYNIGALFTLTTNTNNDIWLDLDTAKTHYNNDDGRLGGRDATILENGSGTLPGYKDELSFNRDQVAVGHTRRFSDSKLETSLSVSKTETLGRTIPGKYADIGNAFTGFPNIIIGDDRLLETTNTVLDTKYVNYSSDSHVITLGGQYWDAELKDGLIPNTLDQTMLAVFLEDEWSITDTVAMTLGGRYDDHDAFGGNFSPRVYLVWNSTDNLTLKGGINQGFRVPRLEQLSNGVSGVSGQGTNITIGNPNLEPEISTNTEIGVLFDNHRGTTASATLFHNQIKDRISSGGDCTVNAISSCSVNPTATYDINIDEAKTWGAELAANFELIKDWNLGLNYTWTDSEITEAGKKNGKLGNTPKHMANASLRWTANEKLNLWLRGEYRGDAQRFTGLSSNLTGNDKLAYEAAGNLKSYTVFNLGGAYKVSEALVVNASINNLLDKDFAKFETYTNTNGDVAYVGEYFQSGRSTTGGIIQGRTVMVAATYNF